jgi:hypothetical protein
MRLQADERPLRDWGQAWNTIMRRVHDMTWEDWEANGWLRPHKTSRQEIRNLPAIVRRDGMDALQTPGLDAVIESVVTYEFNDVPDNSGPAISCGTGEQLSLLFRLACSMVVAKDGGAPPHSG